MPSRRNYNPKRTTDDIINEKIKVLREFHVVNIINEDSIRNMLVIAVKERPDSDPHIVLDRIAKSLIANKL